MTSRLRFLISAATTWCAAIVVAAPQSASAQDPGKVATPGGYEGGYLVFQSADGAFKYWLDGRIQVDAASYFGSDNKLGSGTDIRRARLGWKATLFTDWHGEIDVDFAGNAVEMKDMWLGYEGFKNTVLKVGNYKEPFGLETLTSSKYITFVERSYADNFSPDRNIGLGIVRWGDQWYATAGAFGQVAGTPDATGNDEGHAFTGRFVWAPIKSDEGLLHLGIAASMRTPDAASGADTNTVRFRARPESWISKARFLTTGKIRSVDHTNYYSGELASTRGPATLQGEFTQVTVDRLAGLKAPTFRAGYVQLSYFLTGEHRPYLMEEAEFDRVIPKDKGGAWEIAARWSRMDLNDPTTGVAIAGGSAVNYTLGVNWYINANFKWMLNYVAVANDNNAKPDLGTAPFTVGDKFNIIQTRFALAF
ncbi:MAG TPA: porin [Gemmatimonadaceae bacterium]|nr:porin [Gemmatimonadaceae bacterium]